jgi:hypothetical protein
MKYMGELLHRQRTRGMPQSRKKQNPARHIPQKLPPMVIERQRKNHLNFFGAVRRTRGYYVQPSNDLVHPRIACCRAPPAPKAVQQRGQVDHFRANIEKIMVWNFAWRGRSGHRHNPPPKLAASSLLTQFECFRRENQALDHSISKEQGGVPVNAGKCCGLRNMGSFGKNSEDCDCDEVLCFYSPIVEKVGCNM